MPIDYSKFDAIVDSDDEMEKEMAAMENSLDDKPKHCANCHETPAKPVRCATCKTTLYCNQNCQKADWRFHKRICKKSDDKKDADQKNVQSKPSDDNAAPKSSKDNAGSPPKTSTSSTKKSVVEKSVVEKNDEKIDWYRHRETKLPSCPNSAPKKITNAEDTRVSPEQGSVWNAAGTWEDKDVTKWADDEITKRCTTEVSSKFGLIRTRSVVNKGDASITVIRGSTRYLFDFFITVFWESRISSATSGVDTTVKGELHCDEFSHQANVDSLVFEPRNTSSTPAVVDTMVQHIIDALKQSAKTELGTKIRENLASFAADFEKLKILHAWLSCGSGDTFENTFLLALFEETTDNM
eukprot:GEMP01055293.1.p1 GENE.GEMP01055293.1~~GEMP01055293.1.p1  ORF type:complete len:353 (+),score=69.11 GEMP01055293.1:88-1146(+)